MPAVEEHLTVEDENEINQELLNTIKIPRNINLLKDKLPKSQYDEEKAEERDNVDALLDIYENKYLISNHHSNSETNIIEKPHIKPPMHDDNLPSTTTNKKSESILREIRSRHGQDEPISEIMKKKRKNPRTTPMNPELVSIKPNKNKYQMYRNLNSQSSKNELNNDDMGNKRINYNNIHEKYMKRAMEIEQQEKKLKNELQNRIEDSELPNIYKKSKIGVQRIAYDPRYDNTREYLKSSHKYGSESENTRKPALMIQPRIVSHNSKESISSRGNIISESVSPTSQKSLAILEHKLHPYKNEYGSKSYKLAKIKGLPPHMKQNGKLSF